MSEIHSAALRARWAKVSSRKRTKLMSDLASKKQAALSDRQKRLHALKMARRKKELQAAKQTV